MRSLRPLAAVAVFVVAALLCVLAASFAARSIEDRTARALASTFAAAGETWVAAETDGLLVRLSGTADSEAQRFRVLTLTSSVVDATRVIDEIAVTDTAPAEPPAYRIELLRNGSDVTLIGLVPETMDRLALLDRLTGVTPDAAVADMLDTARDPAPAGWDEAIDFAMATIDRVATARLSISATHVGVEGLADSPAERDRMVAELQALAPEGIEVVLEIAAPRQPITPFALRFSIDARGTRLETCAAETAEGRQQILRAAVAAGDPNPSCVLGLGSPTPSWPAAAATAIRTLAELGGGSITLSDADVALVVPHTVPREAFDAAVGRLETDLPAVFSVTGRRAEAPAAPVLSEAVVEFTATLSPEGLLQLRGRLTDEALRSAVMSYSRAAFGQVSINMAARLDPTLPDGWAGRVLTGLEGLSRMRNGLLHVTEARMELRGTTGDPDAEADIGRLLSERLGPEADVTLVVTYDERLDPVANIPTPESCEARIAEILSERQIGFAPGSATLNDEAAETLDAIADVMRDCGALRMEVAGHTDSQGREETNLALSQSRAEAVVAALMGRRVLVAGLVARGYGEAQPIADNGTEAGREANRRIEFRLIRPEPEPGPDAGDGTEGEPVIVVAPAEEAPLEPPPNPVRAAADAGADAAEGEGGAAADAGDDPAAEAGADGAGTAADDGAADGPEVEGPGGDDEAGGTAADRPAGSGSGADPAAGSEGAEGAAAGADRAGADAGPAAAPEPVAAVPPADVGAADPEPVVVVTEGAGDSLRPQPRPARD